MGIVLAATEKCGRRLIGRPTIPRRFPHFKWRSRARKTFADSGCDLDLKNYAKIDGRKTWREQILIFTTHETEIFPISLNIITSLRPPCLGCAPCLCGESLRRARHSSAKRRPGDVDRLARAISTNLGYEI
ncbi:hypothetical protein DBV15_05753 [Temnothorax longispinosus]|uniref:Uncharacterized protein n=1 Tax=Temnothorax longispinosus TaxID=300112 RepID=A0A4V3SA95_9HYME|nr:hypothetical protein DBV15_05753 [Temnothorax longispinosus]